jgi:hypothetical protein
MKELLDLIIFGTPFAWILLAITFLAIILIPQLFGIKTLNGLIFAQITLFFNAVPIIAGLSYEAVLVERGIHFFAVEFLFYVVIYAIYGRLLRRREQVLEALQRFFASKATIPFIVLILLVAISNAALTPTDGSSRIEYMTKAWFSLLKPLINLALPLAYIGVFILLLNPKRRHLGYLLLAITIISNMMAGSKASFAISLLSACLLLRDLAISFPRLRMRGQDKLKLSLFVAVMVVVALTRINTSAADLSDRFFLFGEATMMTYFADQPTAACQNVSTFASMHRGLARLAGDSSANNIDTLFGFALMIEATGANSFTGPNARLSAYALCNFAGERILLFAIVVAVYLCLMLIVFFSSLNRPRLLAIVYPFILISVSSASQDFNLIMQDITIFIALLCLSLFIRTSKPRPSHA